ncbi:hypothetical protein LTS18_005659 [Coniosporium uncinatum]|uniref:Uncharacterized protein n=1 Tax=Coniosporium uncinatum TaxID=93489 RepID=A0ACC3D4R8_9PEZI|nr:hypothetical protein LTS18_005659 [Coniosporium uncinatum]
MIYDYAVEPNDIFVHADRLTKATRRRDQVSHYFPHPSIPTVLLLNRQFTAEALHVTDQKPLTMDLETFYDHWGTLRYDSDIKSHRLIKFGTLSTLPRLVIMFSEAVHKFARCSKGTALAGVTELSDTIQWFIMNRRLNSLRCNCRTGSLMQLLPGGVRASQCNR